MVLPTLDLLRYSVHIAEAAFEGVVLEDVVAPGKVEGDVDHFSRSADRVRRRQTQVDALLHFEAAVSAGLLPHLVDGLTEEWAR
jgi:hypothetical protein